MGEKKGLLKYLKLDGVISNFTHLIESKIELAKIETKEEIALVLSKMAVFALLVTLGLFFILFLSLALAHYLGDLLANVSVGFMIVSGIYFLFFMVLYLLRNKIKLHERCLELLRKTLHVK